MTNPLVTTLSTLRARFENDSMICFGELCESFCDMIEKALRNIHGMP